MVMFLMRQLELTRHMDSRNRLPTAFLSFVRNLYMLWFQYVPRYKKRSEKKKLTAWLTQMSVAARKNRGYLILHALSETLHYCGKIKDELVQAKVQLLIKHFSYISRNEFLLPYIVHPAEVDWNWNVAHVECWMADNNTTCIIRWGREIAIPAYKAHEKAMWDGKNFKERRRAVNDFLQDKIEVRDLDRIRTA